MNDLRKLNRKQLLEIILAQTREIEHLEDELNKANEKLNSRKLKFKELGTLADASFVLSEIFTAADETAKIYLENVETRCKEIESNYKKELMAKKKKTTKKSTVKKKTSKSSKESSTV